MKKHIENSKSLVGESLEYSNVVFWKTSSYTIDRVIGKIVEIKTKKKIFSLLNHEEKKMWGTSEEFRKKILHEARHNFGENRFIDIFKIKTILLGNRHSKIVSHFYENIGNYPALDDAYNALGSFVVRGKVIWPECIKGKCDWIGRFYFSRENGQAVRNRARIVIELFSRFALPGTTISIACGSGQALILAAEKKMRIESTKNVNLLMTDMSSSPFNRIRELAELAGISNNVKTEQVNLKYNSYAKFTPELSNVEACGIFEYLDDRDSIQLLYQSLKQIPIGGSLIVSNMNRTSSALILEKLFNWHIMYRTTEHFEKLLVDASSMAGCNIQYKIYVEPWKIHYVFHVVKV